MSFLDDIGSSLKDAGTWLGSSGLGPQLAKTALLGFTLNSLSKSVNKENSKPNAANSTQPDRKTREQLSPDTSHSIPVVYGSAFIKGIITDAVLSEDKKTMWYCVTICEATGVKISDNQLSQTTFEEIWWNNGKVAFESDGITVKNTVDDDGNTNSDVAGLAKFYLYSRGSNSQTFLPNISGSPIAATDIFPGWTTNHLMGDLVFAIVKVEYNKERRVTSLGDLSFKVKNTMTLPGDVMYDYMTNTRYGAGINPGEINK